MASSCIKTRTFLLKPKQRFTESKFPLSLQEVVQRARTKCEADLAFCLTCLTPLKESVVNFFTQQGLVASKSPPTTKQDWEETYCQIREAAQQVLFQEIYPKQYLILCNRIAEGFEQVSRKSPEAFKETAVSTIQDAILSPPFKYLNIGSSFTLAGYIFRFRPKIVEAALLNLYFTYRKKIIRDVSLQLLASYLADFPMCRSHDLIQFFQASEPPQLLARKLLARLQTDLERRFPGWGSCQPTWVEFLKELCQVRNLTCEALSDALVYTHFQSCLEPTTQQRFSQTILDSFTSDAQGNPKALPTYFANLLMQKLHRPLKPLFQEVWNNHFRRQANARALVGLKRFVHDFMKEYVKHIPNYRRWKAETMWQALRDPQIQQNRLVVQLEKARPVFRALLDHINWQQLARHGVETFIESTYRQSEMDSGQAIVIPDKQRVFRGIHSATPLQTFKLPPTGEVGSEDIPALKKCLHDFLQTRFQRKAEELIRPTLVQALLPSLVAVLSDPNNFVNQIPEFKNPGFSLPLTNQLSEICLKKNEFQLTLTTSSALFPPHTNWFIFEVQIPRHSSNHPKNQSSSDLSTLVGNDWRPRSLTLSKRGHKLYLHIQFEKELPRRPPKLAIGKHAKILNEIVIGVKLGLHHYAIVSVMRTRSNYWRDETNRIQRKPYPTDTEELAHFFIGEVEALDMDFDSETGRFVNRTPRVGQNPQTPSSQSRGNAHLRVLLAEHRKTLARLHRYQARCPDKYVSQPQYIRATHLLTTLENKIHRLLTTISHAVAVKLQAIVQHYGTAYPDLPVRVQVEDLKRTKIAASVHRAPADFSLPPIHILDFYTHIQQHLVRLLQEHSIGVWRVDPQQSSQLCSQCGHSGQSQNHTFTCQNEQHKSPQGNPYTSNAPLNAVRNLTLFPPLVKKPINI
ncbi:MAG: zinc ribbon domain-containing protein [Candidatus Hodarchaeota archaeon]